MTSGFLKGTAWASGANLFFLAIGYVVQILIGRTLSPADFGTFGVALYLLNLIEYAFTTGLSQSLTKFMAERPATGWSVLRHSVVAQLALVAIISIPLWLLSPNIARWFGDASMTPLFRIVAIILPFYGIRSLLQGILGGQRDFPAQSKVKIVIAVAKLGLIGAALLLRADPASILLAYLLSSLVGAAFGWRQVKPIGRTETLPASQFYRYTFSLTVFLVVFPLFINVDVFLVKRLVEANEQVGWYVAATTLARMPFYLFTGLLLTLLPSVAYLDRTARDQLRRLVREVNRYALLLLLPLTVLVAVTADALIPLIFGPSYRGGDALAVLIVGVSLLVLFRIFSTILVGLTNPGRVTITTFLVIVFDVALNLFLIPRYGILGAAIASTISSALGLLIATIQLHRRDLALLDWRSVGRAAIASGIVGVLVIIHPTNLLLIFILAAAGVLYFGLLILFGEIQPRDRERVRALLKRERTAESELGG